MTVRTRIDTEGLMNQMGGEIIPSYDSTGKDLDTVIDDLLAYQEHSSPITKGTIEPTWEDLSGWVRPTSYTDPSSGWNNEANAYDDSALTYADSDSVAVSSWSEELNLYHAGVVADAVRIICGWSSSLSTQGCYIYAEWDAAWHLVHVTDISGGQTGGSITVEADLGYTKTITGIKVKFLNKSVTLSCTFYVWDSGIWGVEGGKLEFETPKTLQWALLQLHEVVGEGYIEVDNDYQFNWWSDIGEDKGQQIRYRKNMAGMTREVDWGELCTLLYPLGNGVVLSDQYVTKEEADKDSDVSYGYLTLAGDYDCYEGWTGEGDSLPSYLYVYENDVDVTSDWEQGEDEHTLRCAIGDYNGAATYTVSYYRADYLIAWDTVATYGIISKTWTDNTIGTVSTLLEVGRAKLEDLKTPPITYVVDAVDLAEFDGFDFDALQLGSIVTIINEDLSVDESVRVTKIIKPDLMYPARMQVELSNKTKSLLDVISDIKRNL